MFVWKASTILRYFEELLPDVYACLKQIGAALGTEKEQEVLHEVYPTIPKISVEMCIRDSRCCLDARNSMDSSQNRKNIKYRPITAAARNASLNMRLSKLPDSSACFAAA